MILKDIEQQIRQTQQGDYIYPQYSGYCFSNIPDAVQYLFGFRKTTPLSPILQKAGIVPSNRQKVVALLLDAFGWSQWLRYADSFEFLSRLTDRGLLAPLTSVFPSATPVAMASIHSGLTPQEHGMVHASVYFEEIDRIISTIHFRPVSGGTQDQLLEEGVSPRILFDNNTLYEKLGESGISSFTLTHESISNSAFVSVTTKGSTIVPYQGIPGLAETLRSQVMKTASPAYICGYFGIIDIACHNHGVHSNQYMSVVQPLITSLQEDFVEKLPRDVAEETVLLVFADHGHINFDSEKTIYLDDYPQLVENLRIGTGGEKIPPWGGPRVTFLAIKEGRVDETVNYLTEELRGKANVLKSDEALKQGLFGSGDVHHRLKSRIGDILLLAEKDLTLGYRQLYYSNPKLLGTHGGLNPDETLVPFAAARISDLQ